MKKWIVLITAGSMCLTPLPVNAATSQPVQASVWMEEGLLSDEVTPVQEMLHNLGYYPEAPDGYYGAVTAEAVRKFQTDNGLYADGIVGDITMSMLRTNAGTDPAPEATASAPAGTDPAAAEAVTASVTELVPGMSGNSVTELQNMLLKLGYSAGPSDGYYGPVTETAVRQFQEDYGLLADGVAGPFTMEALRTRQTSDSSSGPVQSPFGDLTEGMTGSEVLELQKKLAALRYPVYVDGIFGEQTAQIVRMFQTNNGLYADGVVGPVTNSALNGSPVLYSDASSSQSGSSLDMGDHTGLVREPSSGEWVYVIDGQFTTDYNRMVLTEEDEAAGLKEAFCEVYARNVVDSITSPDMSQEEKLAACFEFTMTEFESTNHPRVPHYTGDDWVYVYAYDMFGPRHGGNCFSYAAAFSVLAKACGCSDVYACNSGGHGWTEVNGLVYDPEQYHDTINKIYAYDYSNPSISNYWPAISSYETYPWMRISLPAF